ncbi:glycosyltransferase family 2 protein [Bittarella massiliensis]|uniref:tetratricopeptide repeat-containing glycosyltransferase family 2 protein n=1 Tax=Bittarella massiliensis (ex Durand et al. 2017) TaxID=1720313 RepID=UPI00163D190C|nr:glycosyltransferase family 2 protein [Bittarella massiliensis (ex Durand et al. 2017)]MBC2870168.1 glycosyltransferase family 2 protein [Bittarella massiliensis (ex Durand et al. 2017)]
MATVSLCMIVRDEEDVLGRCLDSVAGVADEVVVVDTGSRDRTRQIALEKGARVYDFPWCDDFAAARNFALEKGRMEYLFWLDADDVLLPADREALIALKGELDKSVDMVMLRYNTAFDRAGRPTFSFYRERLWRRDRGFRFEGAVHEAVTPQGRVIRREIAVTHQKLHRRDPGRNLRIFEKEAAKGPLTPRQQFYFGRELCYAGRLEEGERVLTAFLEGGQGWVENQVSACRELARCLDRQEQPGRALRALFWSFAFDRPRAEVCCDIARRFFDEGLWPRAIYWYRRALEVPFDPASGGFTEPDCYGFLPHIQLCVCYDRLGDRRRAEEENELAARSKPDHPSVRQNRVYFQARRQRGAGAKEGT